MNEEAIVAVLPRGRLKEYRWVLWMLLGALAIHVMEAVFRLHVFAEFLSAKTLSVIEPLRILADWSLFWGFRKAPTFLVGWAVFISFIVVSRVTIGFYAGEPFNLMVAHGLALLIYGLYATMQETNTRPVVYGSYALIASAILAGGASFVRIFAEGITIGWWMPALLLAAIVIAVQEYVARKGKFEKFFFSYFWMLLPFSFTSMWALYYGYVHAVPTFMFAWAVYTVFDVVIRIVNNTVFMKEPFKAVHGLGMALIVSGMFLTYAGAMTQ